MNVSETIVILQKIKKRVEFNNSATFWSPKLTWVHGSSVLKRKEGNVWRDHPFQLYISRDHKLKQTTIELFEHTFPTWLQSGSPMVHSWTGSPFLTQPSIYNGITTLFELAKNNIIETFRKFNRRRKFLVVRK